ncbi:alpha/beta hydrolase [Paenibacillus albicereus]|uniref:Alpha/beta hydrolase n=1 Tax=Paenibacillus albicereus TaxID=2726185 RepID=A0A6H2GT54_9BACL|nr:alpha/beta hydrolase-fold protein [Paenibacillus albicereus]QJC50328.1 alpha/beta hydrolase [Paenibacillus albicereus]
MKFESIPAAGRMLSVYLPPSYDGGGSRRYPVLYVQDDAELMEHSVNYIDSLYASGELPELIVAGVPSGCRNDDYTPWPAAAVAPGRPGFGGAGRAYVDELADRIKPALDAHLRTMPEPEHTGIGGGSLGGLIALFAAYWRPDAFGSAAAISPSLWYEGALDYIRREAAPDGRLRLYLSVGTAEGSLKTNRQRGMAASVPEAARILLAKGFPPQRLRLELEPGGTHDAMFMALRFPAALRFLFGAAEAEPADLARSGAAEASRPAPAAADGRPTDVGAWSGRAVGAAPAAPIADVSRAASIDAAARAAGRREAELSALLPADAADLHASVTPCVALPVRYSVPGTECFAMTSRAGLDYSIFVHVPKKPAPPSGYPLLCAVDGNSVFASLAEAMRLQTRHPKGLPPGLVVGIGYPTDEPFATDRRFVDLTVPADMQGRRPDGTPWPANGGAEAFLDFMQEELLPELMRRYPLDPQRRTLFGHSLGGFFSLYALIRRPELFRSHIAGSPSLWWNERMLLELLPELEARLNSGGSAALMLAIGEGEKGSMLQDTRELKRRLLPLAESGRLRLSYAEFEGEGHVSVLHPLLSPMLRFSFWEEAGAELSR